MQHTVCRVLTFTIAPVLAVPQLVSTGRSALSSRSMKGHGEQLAVSSSLDTRLLPSVFLIVDLPVHSACQ